jgi:Putative transposase
MTEGTVTFRWRDYTHRSQTRTMTLEADEFLRRFLLHVLPTSFVRIRYFGLLANRHRAQLLQRCRSYLQTKPTLPLPTPLAAAHRCQHCHRGTMRQVETLSPMQLSAWLPDSPTAEDSS